MKKKRSEMYINQDCTDEYEFLINENLRSGRGAQEKKSIKQFLLFSQKVNLIERFITQAFFLLTFL